MFHTLDSSLHEEQQIVIKSRQISGTVDKEMERLVWDCNEASSG